MSFSFIVIAAGALYIAWRGTRKSRRAGRNPNNSSVLPPTRAQQSGELGEQRTHAALLEVLPQLCGQDFYLHEGALIVEHAPGTAFPTAEIDHLAITPFGVFVFETKNWSGHISASESDDRLVRTMFDGTRELRKSPLAQNRSKVAFLRNQLPPFWPVSHAGVFTAENVAIDPTLPLNLIKVASLAQWLRTERQKFGTRRPVDVRRAKDGVLMYADLAPGAIERHQERVRLSP
ncbi:nuclease-related domain-containing protein [Caballeronia sp. dw_19]|uniref:nuclease-related domain-containing protein n=1 Tax=Caballeronia sp. dw_19 TaxID=2719791 RepID=UPI001BD456A1|nr:nuclease-related domain-containing protein [Caballeronia sp. dw_19]